MSTQIDESSVSGEVWMRADGHLVITVPYGPCRNQPERIIRHRLMEGLAKRWLDRPVPEGFGNKVTTQALEIMEDTDEPGRAIAQYGVVLT